MFWDVADGMVVGRASAAESASLFISKTPVEASGIMQHSRRSLPKSFIGNKHFQSPSRFVSFLRSLIHDRMFR